MLNNSPIMLDGTNREHWKLYLQSRLQAKGLWRFITREVDGEEVAKEKTLGIINMTLPMEYRRKFAEVENPSDLWTKVNHMYDSMAAGKMDAAETLLSTFLWDGADIESNYERFVQIRSNFEGLGGEMTEEKYARLFLCYMRIPEFEYLKQLLISDPRPIDRVVTMLRQQALEEKLMNDLNVAGAVEPPARRGRVLTTTNQSAKRKPRCFHCGERGHLKRNCPERMAQKEKEYGQNDQRRGRRGTLLMAEKNRGANSARGGMESWILDSGATSHVYRGPRSDMIGYEERKGEYLECANSERLTVQGMGTLCFGDVTLTDVCHVPGCNSNLLSVPAMAERGATIKFKGDGCSIIKDNDVVWRGNRGERGLYVFMDPRMTKVHERPNMLKRTVKKKERKTYGVGEKLYTDVNVIGVPSMSGKKYLDVLVDAESRYVHAEALDRKSQCFQVTKDTVQWYERQFGIKTKCIKSDQGGEYVSRAEVEWASDMGIDREYTNIAVSRENGRVERVHRNIMEKVRADLYQARMDDNMWGEAAMTAVYRINRTKHSVTGKSPFEMLFGITPDRSSLKPFGCAAYYYQKGSMLKTT